MSTQIIKQISHGVHGVDPEDCPLCPLCDQPMWLGERLTLQTIDAGSGHPDLVRIVHSDCECDEDEGEDEDEDETNDD